MTDKDREIKALKIRNEFLEDRVKLLEKEEKRLEIIRRGFCALSKTLGKDREKKEEKQGEILTILNDRQLYLAVGEIVRRYGVKVVLLTRNKKGTIDVELDHNTHYKDQEKMDKEIRELGGIGNILYRVVDEEDLRMTKAKEIVEFLKPCLERQYVVGSHKYQTNWGLKTMEELIASLRTILYEQE